jgi:hypothetical protein
VNSTHVCTGTHLATGIRAAAGRRYRRPPSRSGCVRSAQPGDAEHQQSSAVTVSSRRTELALRAALESRRRNPRRPVLDTPRYRCPGGRNMFATAGTTSDACAMRANRSARIVSQRTTQHGRNALTCENTTNRHPRAPVITAQACLLICGFGVQVPGGAPPLTWPFAVSGPPPPRMAWAQTGQMRARSEHGLHASLSAPQSAGVKGRSRAPQRSARRTFRRCRVPICAPADFVSPRGIADPSRAGPAGS